VTAPRPSGTFGAASATPLAQLRSALLAELRQLVAARAG
jgi:hypothetical protein